MRTKSLLKLSIIAVLSATVFISCNKEDEVKTVEDPNSGTLTCEIDGATFTATSFSNTLIGDDTGKRLDIRATDASGKQLIITINDVEPLGTNFSHLGDTVYVDALENTPLGIMTLGTLNASNGTSSMTFGDGKESGYSILTSCDLTDKTVSGVFEFIISDFQNNETINISGGEFSDLTYSEL